jgi:hypothetical protein
MSMKFDIPDRNGKFTGVGEMDGCELYIEFSEDGSILKAFDNNDHGRVALTSNQTEAIEEEAREYLSELAGEESSNSNPYSYHGVSRSDF